MQLLAVVAVRHGSYAVVSQTAEPDETVSTVHTAPVPLLRIHRGPRRT